MIDKETVVYEDELLTIQTSTRNQRPRVLSRWRSVSATLFAATLAMCTATLAMCTASTGCAASDEYAQAPPQPSEQAQPLVRSLDPGVENAIRACVKEGVSRLKWHSYDISFEVQATPEAVVQDVETKGKRLDDKALETCMMTALKAMPVRDLLKPDDSLLDDSVPASSQSISPAARSLMGHAEVLPQLIRLAPIVLTTPTGVTIVVAVVVVVAVAAVISNSTTRKPTQAECDEEKALVTAECIRMLALKDPPLEVVGRNRSLAECIINTLTEDCGGKPLDWGKQGRPGRRY
jgi:hypothetical protein